ncbi:uncharacterized protein [Haliotis asinina]|uniref:uncharacterized protein n=1 Tax=Haliotis asinina TaxID=109174 RepID=UPI003531FEB4
MTDQQRSPRLMGKRNQTPSCCVPGCTSFRQKDKLAVVKLSYHRIPIHDKKRTKLWLDKIGRSAWLPNSSSRICSIHFEGGKKSDNPKEPGYIPTIFPSRQKPIKQLTSSKAVSPPAKCVSHKINQSVLIKGSTDQQRSPQLMAKRSQLGPFCCVPGCTNFRQKDKLAGVKLFYHRIPMHDKKRTKLWLDKIGRNAWLPNSSSRICSIHFEGGKKSDNPKKPGYIPTIFPSCQKPMKRQSTLTSSKAVLPAAKHVSHEIIPVSSASSPSSNTLPLFSSNTHSQYELDSPSISDSAPPPEEQPQVIPSRMDHDYVYPYMDEVERLKLQLHQVQCENENLKKTLCLYRKKDNDTKFHYMSYLPNSDTFEVQTVSAQEM